MIAKSGSLNAFINRKKKGTTFFHCKSSVSLPKDFKAGHILVLGKSIPVVVLILQMFLSYLHNCHGQQSWKNLCVFPFFPSFCFYILDKPNMQPAFLNGMLTFITVFYDTFLNERYVLYLWESSLLVFLVNLILGTLDIAQVSQELNQYDLVFSSYRTMCIILLYLVHALILLDCRET